MIYQPFEVVVVPFPYADRLSEKRRPALVVSVPRLSSDHGRLWLAMITSAAATEHGDVILKDMAAAGLPLVSTLRASKIATIDSIRVIRVLGQLSAHDEKSARAALQSCAAF